MSINKKDFIMLPHTLNFNNTALIIVDLQQGYCRPGSDCAQPPLSWDVSEADELCKLHVEFVNAARKILPPENIIWTQMEETAKTYAKNTPMPDDPDFIDLCVRGTAGHDFHVVAPAEGEAILFKTHPSAFHRGAEIITPTNRGDDLETYLNKRKIENTGTTGVIGPRCVNGTLIGSSIAGFNTYALRDFIGQPTYTRSDLGGKATMQEEARIHEDVTDFFYAQAMSGQQFLEHLNR